jgi:hypothetical protein
MQYIIFCSFQSLDMTLPFLFLDVVKCSFIQVIPIRKYLRCMYNLLIHVNKDSANFIVIFLPLGFCLISVCTNAFGILTVMMSLPCLVSITVVIRCDFVIAVGLAASLLLLCSQCNLVVHFGLCSS